jgi:vanillate O-demethylase ferredoxin subunit
MMSETEFLPAVVDAVADLSPTVRLLRLRPADGITPFGVGSHLRVRLHVDGRELLRHYSIVGLPQDARDARAYTIAVKRAEPGRGGSRAMWALRPGDTLPIAGPHNHFELPVGVTHALLVAGGIGITPIVGMALALAARATPLRLCYAARDEGELVFAERLRAALGEGLATFVDARGERLDLDAEIGALPANATMFICGPVPLLQAAQAAWERAGRAKAALRFETFGSSGHRPAQAFRVRLPRHALDLEVPADRSLLEVLEEQGVAVLSDCRRGECGLCALEVLALDGEIDHRDVFFSAAEQRTNHSLCTCVSRVCGGSVALETAFRPDSEHARAA